MVRFVSAWYIFDSEEVKIMRDGGRLAAVRPRPAPF
jgi:hypothetical protein